MRVMILLAFLLSMPVLASVPAEFDLSVPVGKVGKLRVYEQMQDEGVPRQVLVGAFSIPEGSGVRIRLNDPLLYRWILNDESKIIQSSMPYFQARVFSLPESFDSESRDKILNGEFYIHIRDLDAAAIIAAIYRDTLPQGVERVSHPLLWDDFNPQGTWAHAIELGLRQAPNSFLVENSPRDMKDFCPRFDTLKKQERELFWIALMNLVARFESAYIPLTASDEGRYDESNKGIISSGLTQISIASTRASCYQARGCNFVRNQEDLFQPDRGLRCSIGIMSCLVESGGCLSCKKNKSWYGIARYWSTLRDPYEIKCPTCPGGKITIGKKPQILELLKSTASFCF